MAIENTKSVGFNILALACVLTLVESGVIKKQESGCEAIRNCSAPLYEYLGEYGYAPSYFAISNEEILGQFCQLANALQECIDINTPNCESQHLIYIVQIIGDTSAYICEEEGRAATLALEQSMCSRDDRKQQEFIDEVGSCLNTLSSDFEIALADEGPLDFCPFERAWAECVDNAARDKCGDAYAQYIRTVIHVWLTYENGFSCLDSVSDKRAKLTRSVGLTGETFEFVVGK